MSFVIQWLVCLVAFLAGSAVAYGIALLFRPKGQDATAPEPAVDPEPRPEPRPDPKELSEASESSESESSEIGAKR